MKKLFYLSILILFFACEERVGTSYHEIYRRQLPKSKFKEGDIVYVKPDSLKGVITCVDLTHYTCWSCGNTDTSLIYYVRNGTNTLTFKQSDFYEKKTEEINQ